MLIRPKYHWSGLLLSGFQFLCAFIVLEFKTDHFMVQLYLVSGSFIAILWSSTYTELSDGILTRRCLWFTRCIAVREISLITPHPRNGQRGYGTVATLFTRDGSKLNLQPNLPMPFLTLLHQQAPQAEYLF
jgi:hypothetical protein